MIHFLSQNIENHLLRLDVYGLTKPEFLIFDDPTENQLSQRPIWVCASAARMLVFLFRQYYHSETSLSALKNYPQDLKIV